MYTQVIVRVCASNGIPMLPRPTNTLGIMPITFRPDEPTLHEQWLAAKPSRKSCRPYPRPRNVGTTIAIGLMVIDKLMAEELRRIYA